MDRDEALALMALFLHFEEVYILMETANRLSRKRFRGKGENHFHIRINVAPFPRNCRFCSLPPKSELRRSR